MKESVKVAAAQIDVKLFDSEANLARHWRAVEEISSESKIDLIVFPELANSGYVVGLEQLDRNDITNFIKQYLKVAEKIPGNYTNSLAKLARKYKVYIVTGILEEHPTISCALYNSSVLIAPSGDILGVYRKAHVIREEKHYFISGNRADVYSTELGNIGLLICADNSFPELPRLLVLKGAEIICVSYSRIKSAVTDPQLYDNINSCRAYENNTFFIACNRVGSENNQVFEGRSCICDPYGSFLAHSNTASEDIIRAELFGSILGEARIRFARFRDRRPIFYKRLCINEEDDDDH